jgi:ABC-type arginine transport system ATPase subunit
MAFRSVNLWAHRTALENVFEMPLHVLGETHTEVVARAEHLLERVGVADKRAIYPIQILLPTLVGETAMLLKSTAQASTVAVMDVLGAANYIRA